ncbi:hypothetical protein KIN20_024087 [Parelaphostrongylus tenuis]|uniref:Uncharacterized protein n=1 Tax=Parelaphostrongylus tenuis TaxID=148309 RepID=A0AAD5MSV2_PARTN|nr:hypothetical protein KIN20_024087 [Parelaphostrongylus tenuis]
MKLIKVELVVIVSYKRVIAITIKMKGTSKLDRKRLLNGPFGLFHHRCDTKLCGVLKNWTVDLRTTQSYSS